MCLIAAWASWKRGGKYIAEASPDDDVGAFGAPGPLGDGDEAPKPEEWVPA